MVASKEPLKHTEVIKVPKLQAMLSWGAPPASTASFQRVLVLSDYQERGKLSKLDL